MTRQQSGAHDFVGDGPLVSFFEGMVLGNGDLGAIMYGNQFELKFNLGKNDVWDARFDSDAEADILKHDDLIKLIEEYGVEAFRSGQTGNLGPGQPTWMMNPVGKKAIALDVRTVYATPAFYENGRYCRPCPKRVGEVVFVGPGLNTTPMKSCLSIEEGVISVEFRYNDHTSVRLEGFIWAESNIFCLRVEVKGDLQWGGWAKLIMRKWPDAVDASIPDPVLETPFERIVTLTQEIPGDDAVDPFSWTLAAVAPGSRMDQRYESIISLPKEGAVADHFFAVATSRDSHDPKRAIELAIQAHTQGYDVLQASQKEWWSSFWQRSSVELEDKELESAWYRDLYLLACNLKEGKQAPGLFGNMTTWDASMWHSDYHMDKNFQKNFYPVLVTNHCEMSEPYFSAIGDHLPSAQWRAEKDYGVEGAHFDVSVLPFLPPEKMYINNTNGRQLGLSGWALGQYWQYYLYTKDAEWLGETGYPVIKKVAQFYWNYLEKYQERCGGDIYPSACLESLPSYRNVFQDLLFFKYAFRAALRSAEILGIDDDWQNRWREGLDRVPAYNIVEYDGKKRLAEHKEIEGAELYSANTFFYAGYIAGPLIFPGEDVDPESDSELVQVIRESMEEFRAEEAFSHNFLAFSLDVPAARLKMEKAYHMVRHSALACRYPSGNPSMFTIGETDINGLQMYPYSVQVEDYTMPFVISELLFQSYAGVLRLFPAWPREKAARFESLRGEGGFLVSSSLKAGKIGTTKIRSTVGGQCNLQWTGEPIEIADLDDSARVSSTREGDVVSFNTVAGHTYSIG